MERQALAGIESSETLTKKELGRGLALLGGILLMVTGFLYIMSFLNRAHYSLFSGQIHLTFYIALGTGLIVSGAALAKYRC